MSTLRSVMTPKPRTIDSSATIRAAIAALEAGGVRHLPVVDEGALVGILSDRDLRPWRQALLDETNGEESLRQAALDIPISTLMTFDVTTLEPEASVRDAVTTLLDEHVGAVPIVERGELVGIVTTVDLLELLGDLLDGAPEALTASDFMSTDVFSVRAHETVARAIDVMLDHSVRHVPVLDECGRLVGIVSNRDLLAEGCGDGAWQRVDHIMSVPRTVDPETPIPEVARMLREHEIGCVPVVEDGFVLGLVTEADFVYAFMDRATERPETGLPVEVPTGG